jgi:hypothetical protein
MGSPAAFELAIRYFANLCQSEPRRLVLSQSFAKITVR